MGKVTYICPVCKQEHPRDEMEFTYDCHGIPFRLVCRECWQKIMEERGYDGQYYYPWEENIYEY